MTLGEREAAHIRNTVYTSKEETLSELERRRNNTELKEKVAAFLEKCPAQFYDTEPFFAFSRVIFTPNFEFDLFNTVARELQLPTKLLEYTDGKFVARDSEKYQLAKLYFLDYEHIGRRGGVPCRAKRIVDFNTYEGHHFKEVPTTWGEPIVDFHHWLLDERYPKTSETIHDFSDWFNTTRTMHEQYYFFFLSLFVYQGVLCENYLLDDSDEADFAVNNLMPSFHAVTKYFGVKPLIYHLLPTESEDSRDWLSYNGDILPLVLKHEEKYSKQA